MNQWLNTAAIWKIWIVSVTFFILLSTGMLKILSGKEFSPLLLIISSVTGTAFGSLLPFTVSYSRKIERFMEKFNSIREASLHAYTVEECFSLKERLNLLMKEAVNLNQGDRLRVMQELLDTRIEVISKFKPKRSVLPHSTID